MRRPCAHACGVQQRGCRCVAPCRVIPGTCGQPNQSFLGPSQQLPCERCQISFACAPTRECVYYYRPPPCSGQRQGTCPSVIVPYGMRLHICDYYFAWCCLLLPTAACTLGALCWRVSDDKSICNISLPQCINTSSASSLHQHPQYQLRLGSIGRGCQAWRRTKRQLVQVLIQRACARCSGVEAQRVGRPKR